MSRTSLAQRVNVAAAAVAAVVTGSCVHDFAPVQVGETQRRKGYRPHRKCRTGVAEACTRCGAIRAGFVVAP